MNWRGLTCAACGRPVTDGACPLCRSAREQFQREARQASWQLLALVVVALVVLSLLALSQR